MQQNWRGSGLSSRPLEPHGEIQNKTTMTGLPIIKSLFIEDDEGFQFPKCSHHFVNYSEFAENEKMNVFSGCYPPDVPLLPKVLTEGSIPFLLPKDEKSKYYVFIKGDVKKKIEDGVETKSEHYNGWIYVLINPTFQQNLLKIGVTQRTPEERAIEMSRQTGLPTPFSVYFKIEVSKCNIVERIIHDKLAKYRYAANREFFEVSLEEAVSFIKKVADDYPKEKVPDPEELKKRQQIKEIEKQIKQLKEELAELEKQ
ncbi:MAG: GIY-YIG nuclease family protein [Desulfobacterales bacterium]|nr:GIY-YIG nuclease family protein [Desulfobacterales bacterium]